jgi:site-specific DNA-methyltransferase (adenine-specific)/modification methylase
MPAYYNEWDTRGEGMRVETIGDATLYCGDCLEILQTLGKVDCVVTDPPYGGGLAMDYAKRFKSKAGKWWKNTDRSEQKRHEDIVGDDAPFDPSHILALNVPSVLWGANWYAARLPDSGGWFVWDKRNGKRNVVNANWPMSEAELAWTNTGKGVRVFRHTWFGLIRDSERGESWHPTQKPVALYAWCLGFASGTVLDPYMGSGPCGVACANLGHKFIGVEIEPKYFDIACERIANAYKQERLFDPEQLEPTQGELL